ncbi:MULTISPECIES: FadR/GntR family transcriptional regulator [Pseudonocardia]|uniref:HTH-type transcriptional regulator LutR n=2 Tax=Pseudonocardia TaxID=1847 RepID=A0A1Y2N6V3_PSEAH|nr:MULTISPECIES: FCD domain-containing protein [Pseudonocardia]OSY42827.1 HTH-type transcriptional regulator LutR [Pseudonocardia autotrophica]TDN77404.1 GntR family transcriptional regulator [Pseudonocardia autotrophica]BBG01428.1 GntR family transcriptional regulator [Pseudonocardia autotrophica]GEC24484.1 GntR family transcriptional regulator [Pseudonocardia saturnea]
MTETRRARPATYEMVLEHVVQRLTTGEWRPGDRLPPERELAARLGASRQAVREALRVLQAQGVIRSQVGTGADSGTVVVPAPARALGRVLALHLAVDSFPVDDVTEARVMLERFSAELAARRRTAADLLSMAADLDAMDADLGPEEFSDADIAFHVAIAGAAGNRLVNELTVAIRESVRGFLLGAMREQGDWPALRDRLRAEHREIHAALSGADGAAAADLIEAHIRAFHGRLGG